MSTNGNADHLSLLWEEYKKTGRIDLQNQLVEHHFPIVKYHAGAIAKRLPRFIIMDDLISSGSLGLIKAVKKFDLKYGVKFTSYCTKPIRCSILEDLRQSDWVPKTARRRTVEYESMRKSFEDDLYTPTAEEVSSYLGISMRKARNFLSDIITPIPLVVNISRESDGDCEEKFPVSINNIEDRKSLLPEEVIDRKEMSQLIEEAISLLNDKENFIITLHYIKGVMIKDITKELSSSKAWVCQLHKTALCKMRRYIERKFKKERR